MSEACRRIIGRGRNERSVMSAATWTRRSGRRRRTDRRRRAVPYFLKKPGGIFGASWLLLLIVLAFTAPLWRPYDIDEQDLANRLALPSAAHWLGTDKVGRDLLSRIFSAAAEPMLGSLVTVAVAFAIGVPLALLAAEHGPQGGAGDQPVDRDS